MGQAARKVIALPAERGAKTLGTDELNICEFPLSIFGRVGANSPKTLRFEDEIFDEGSHKQVQRRLVVSASDAFGLPTPSDTDVLLVLMHLTGEKNGFKQQTVKFTRYELVKVLGWDQGGKSYKRLEESLNRWASVTLYYNQAWWDKAGRAWRSRTFHVLESVDLRGRSVSNDDCLSSFTWNEVLFESFKENHLKRLDLDTYFSLTSPTARQAYRFLDKRFYRSKRLQFDLRAFACEHVGLSRSYDNGQLKRKLKRALDELEEIGFLQPAKSKERYRKETRGKWIITLYRQTEAESKEVLTQDTQNISLENELIGRGVSKAAASALVKNHSEEKIREKLEFHDWLHSQDELKRPKNPGGYLAASIRDDWALPKEFTARATAATRETGKLGNVPSEREKQLEEQDERRSRKFSRFWKSLSKRDQQRVEQEATSGMGRLQADTYRRLEKKGGALFEQMRLMTIQNYAESKSLF